MTKPSANRRANPALPSADAEAAFRAFWQAASRLRRLAEVRFAVSGLTPAQWRVLKSLHEHAQTGGWSVRATDLCNELLLTRATMSGLLGRLLRMGMVSRSQVELDQRARAVALTPAGRRLVNNILFDHLAWMSELMAGLTRAEQRRLAGILCRLCAWLDPLVQRASGAALVESSGPGDELAARRARRRQA